MGYNFHQTYVPYDVEQLLADLKKNYRGYIGLVASQNDPALKAVADAAKKAEDAKRPGTPEGAYRMRGRKAGDVQS